MQKPLRKSCRPQSLVGAWAIEPMHFRRMYEMAMRVDLAELARARAEGGGEYEADAGEPLYTMLDGGVALITISGPLTKYVTSFDAMFGGTSTVLARRAVRQARDDDNVKAMLLHVESPGGTVEGTFDLADEIYAFRTVKPVVAWCPDICCSGGYLLACQADSVFLNATGVMGNIGAYCVLQDTTGLQEKEGYKLTLVATAPFKGLGADGKVTDVLIEEERRQLMTFHELFVAAVVRGRGMDPGVAAALADGRAHIGRQAVDLDLADGVGTVETALARLDAYLNTTEPAGPA